MTDYIPEYNPDDETYPHELFRQILLESVEENIDEDDNRDTIRNSFNQKAIKLIGEGRVVMTGAIVQRRLIDEEWRQLNAQASRATQTILKDIKDGRVPLMQVEQVLDAVITAGKDRRTTLRRMKLTDLERMTREREENFAKQKAAIDDWHQEIEPRIKSLLTTYGGMAAAFHAGAVATIEDESA